MRHAGGGSPQHGQVFHLYFILEEDFCLAEKQGENFPSEIRKSLQKFTLKNLQEDFVTFKAPFH